MPVGLYQRMSLQNRVHDVSQGPGAFAVDDAELVDALCVTFLDVGRHQRRHILWGEGVEIECAINRLFEGFVGHRRRFYAPND